MFAVSLALVAQEFAAGRERATAMGVYGATIGAAVAVGPLVGGAVTDGLGWRTRTGQRVAAMTAGARRGAQWCFWRWLSGKYTRTPSSETRDPESARSE